MNSSEIISTLNQVSGLVNSGLTKLPVIPNTKGNYVAQYCVDKGLNGPNVIVIRVYPDSTSVGVYYLSPHQKNCRNLNSSNFLYKISSKEHLLMWLFKQFNKVNDNEHNVDIFIKNVNKLAIEKRNPWASLEKVVSELTGADYVINTKVQRYGYQTDYISPQDALKAAQTILRFIEHSTEHGGCLDKV